MANTSILAAFERMWQHIVAIVSNKSDLDHTHKEYATSVALDTLESEVSSSISNITNGSIIVANATHAVNADSASEAIHATSADSATTATKASQLTTERTISLTGDVTGSVSFNGTKDVSITATIADDSHNHVISNIDGLQSALDSKTPAYTHGTEDLVAGESVLATGTLYFVYE